MNKNPATAEQLLELATLQIKRLKEVADQEEVKTAIVQNNHGFWQKFAEAMETLKTKAVEGVKSILRTAGKVVTVDAIKVKNTSNCFTDQARYSYRDSDLDRFLPKVQREQSASQFTVCELTETSTFKQMAESILGISGDINTLSQLLKQRGHTVILPAIEALIERQENGEDIGLNINGYANFFFVENKEGQDENVSVVLIYRLDGRWRVYQHLLSRGYRWSADRRIFLRNFLGTI